MIVAADIVLPISAPPIPRGALAIDGQRIVSVGPRDEILAANRHRKVLDFGRAIVMPGLVNCHTHLEYTDLGPVDSPKPFLPWLHELVVRRQTMEPADWQHSARHGTELLLRSGTTCIGDIVTDGAGLTAALEAGLRGTSYVEAVGIRFGDLETQLEEVRQKLDWARTLARGSALRIGLSPHTVYTLSSPVLERLAQMARQRNMPLAIHLAETRAELQLVASGTGELADVLAPIGGHDLIDSGGRGISPVEHVARLGLAGPDTLAVHCVHVSADDAALLATHGASVCLCPRSNAMLQAGQAPWARLRAHDVRIALGTDSLASNTTLDLFGEMRLLWETRQEGSVGNDHPNDLSPRDLVRAATLTGAELLGASRDIGSLEPGKYADLAVLRLLDQHVDDPYEHIVTRAQQDHIISTIIGGKIVCGGNEAMTCTPNAGG